ncbi:HAD-IB family hydrolase [Streptomyces sp. SID10853]|uniref:HAD family hydrolase n=1 Tax=Streptomyces sp. SID10853 TaxID=2706028 RepID=UPI0013BEDB72|nr:HAD-IB family hydrolase [Streptomyces sp. SID10853]NDZ78744.1 HAD-IB family hydrolase [Streptomyces sp. SID10853]
MPEVPGSSEPTACSAVDIALFDVDETLITVKSMFSFLEFHYRERGLPASAYAEAAGNLRERAAAGVSRQRTNCEYYRLFAGRPQEEVYAHGRAWFAAELARGTLLHRPAVDALRRHRRDGALIALVSGSFRPCLEPLAEHLGADVILCSEPETAGGCFTGRLARAAIGPEKGRLARELMARHAIPASRAAAYGDHASDLDLLRSVGRPVAVGGDLTLGGHVTRAGGATLPGVRPAAPVEDRALRGPRSWRPTPAR